VSRNESYPVNEYLSTQLDRARTVIKSNLSKKNTGRSEFNPDFVATMTESLIVQLSTLMASEFQPTVEGISENFIPMVEWVKAFPDSLRSAGICIDGIDFVKLGMKNPLSGKWYDLLLPKNERIWLKGGPPRAGIDITAASPISMLSHELPWNDVDAIASGEGSRIRRITRLMGVDPDGVEMVEPGNDKPDFTLYCLGRDTTQNQVYLGSDGLHYSDAAFYAAQTGEIRVVGQYIGGRALYGVDVMNFAGVEMVKPRGMMRLVKAVVEGKALCFDYLPGNSTMDMGIYWLVLSRKWLNRDTFGEYMQKMYYLGKQMGQVADSEQDIYDVLARAHGTYPFFDFESTPMNEVGIARWKAGKLIKQADREFGWKYRVPSGIRFSTLEEDLTSRKISLKGFTSSPHHSASITNHWSIFLNECRYRTQRFYQENHDAVSRFFLKSDLEESILDQFDNTED